jgi:hypothetical protein
MDKVHITLVKGLFNKINVNRLFVTELKRSPQFDADFSSNKYPVHTLTYVSPTDMLRCSTSDTTTLYKNFSSNMLYAVMLIVFGEELFYSALCTHRPSLCVPPLGCKAKYHKHENN